MGVKTPDRVISVAAHSSKHQEDLLTIAAVMTLDHKEERDSIESMMHESFCGIILFDMIVKLSKQSQFNRHRLLATFLQVS